MSLAIRVVKADPAKLCSELAAFEELYGVPTARRSEAFTDAEGRFVETNDWARWSVVHVKHRRVCSCTA
jgi:hypothetical protein